MAKGIVQVSITNDGDDYLLSLEDEDGDTSEFQISFEQLDLLSEAIEAHLNADEAQAFGVDDGSEPEDEA